MAQAIPTGSEGLIPHLIVDGCANAIDFYTKAFGAEEVMRMPSPDGRIMHAELTIGGRRLYVADDFPEMGSGKARHPIALGGTPITVHQYVEDCDAAVQRAQDAGAQVIMPPEDMFWGDRYATVVDPFGHAWSFATHVADPTPEEMEEAAQKAFS